jgi:hypothetical protein
VIVAAWLGYPLVVLALALGCGLLLEAVSRARLGVLLLPAGFAVIVAVGAIPVAFSSGGQWAAPLVVACAAAGFVSRGWWLRGRVPGAALASFGVYVMYALPVVLSGAATFAGYIKLDDTATFLGMGDRIVEHGHGVALPPSSYEAMLSFNLGRGYPVGSLLPFAIGSRVTGVDAAWIYQPTLAVTAALLALCLYTLAEPFVRRPALVAFVGAQPAILYGYALWGGVKEVTAALFVVLAVALAARGALVPLAVAGAALLDVLSVGGLVWLLPVAVFVVVIHRTWSTLAAGALLTALAIPALINARAFFGGDTVSTLRSGSELGNLIRPLSLLQLAGIWPVGDFRFHPHQRIVTALLIVLVVAAALACAWFAAKRGLLGLPLLLAVGLIGAAVYAGLGSPWVAAKAYATAAPAVLAVGLAGALSVRARYVGAVALALIAAGVLWSNALAYRDVALAPHDRLAELATIGHRFAGDGPALMTEYNPYGVRHFLRRLDPEGASELRRHEVVLAHGGTLQKGASADANAFALSSLQVYRTLVLRRSPVATRPPSDWTLAWRGRYYDVWERAPGARVLEHVASPACPDIRRLAKLGALVAAPSRPVPLLVNLGAVPEPAGWTTVGDDPEVVVPSDHGAVASFVTIPAAGRYAVWLGGTFGGAVDVLVDGRRVAGGHNRPDWPGLWAPLGAARLTAGRHAVILRYTAGSWTPGAHGGQPLIGPLALAPDAAPAQLIYTDAAALCGQRLDWVAALAR